MGGGDRRVGVIDEICNSLDGACEDIPAGMPLLIPSGDDCTC